MTINRWAGNHSAWLALALLATLPQGCAEPQRPLASTRVFATDLAGSAKKCDASRPDLADGKTVGAEIRVANDGGWCAVTVAQRNGNPFDTGLLTARPDHGKVLIHRVGDNTRISYTPAVGYVGTDAFSVRLVPGDATIKVAVTVARP